MTLIPSPSRKIIVGAAVIDDVLALVVLGAVTAWVEAGQGAAGFRSTVIIALVMKTIGFLVLALVLGTRLTPTWLKVDLPLPTIVPVARTNPFSQASRERRRLSLSPRTLGEALFMPRASERMKNHGRLTLELGFHTLGLSFGWTRSEGGVLAAFFSGRNVGADPC